MPGAGGACSAVKWDAAAAAVDEALSFWNTPPGAAAEVREAFREHAGKSTHELIETLGEELAQIALEQFGATAVRLSVEKPGAVPGTDAVGIEIERRRTSGPSGRAR